MATTILCIPKLFEKIVVGQYINAFQVPMLKWLIRSISTIFATHTIRLFSTRNLRNLSHSTISAAQSWSLPKSYIKMAVSKNKSLNFMSLNICGTKEKIFWLTIFCVLIFFFLQENMQTHTHRSSLRKAPIHHKFMRESKKTRGRPSRSLAILVTRSLSLQQIHSEDNNLVNKVGNVPLVNAYLPCYRITFEFLLNFFYGCTIASKYFLKLRNRIFRNRYMQLILT